jgi:hypothetical protein
MERFGIASYGNAAVGVEVACECCRRDGVVGDHESGLMAKELQTVSHFVEQAFFPPKEVCRSVYRKHQIGLS